MVSCYGSTCWSRRLEPLLLFLNLASISSWVWRMLTIHANRRRHQGDCSLLIHSIHRNLIRWKWVTFRKSVGFFNKLKAIQKNAFQFEIDSTELVNCTFSVEHCDWLPFVAKKHRIEIDLSNLDNKPETFFFGWSDKKSEIVLMKF